MQLPAHVVAVRLARPFREQIVDVGVEVIGQRRRLVIGHGGFGRGHNTGLDQFGPSLQFGEYPAGGILVAAAGRDFHDNPFAVAILRRVGASGHGDSARLGVLVAGNECRAGLALGVFPTGQPLAFADDYFCACRQRFCKRFPVNGSHKSPL
ncbi:MAG TPA: hypothetical protein VG125_00175 [Pirellulales bacterium]|nr:hypothetical protein [Pirellulales bacterium]